VKENGHMCHPQLWRVQCQSLCGELAEYRPSLCGACHILIFINLFAHFCMCSTVSCYFYIGVSASVD